MTSLLPDGPGPATTGGDVATDVDPRLRAGTEVRDLLARVAADPRAGDDDARADALFARVAWSRLAEPGDGVAGEVLAALGPRRALHLLVTGAGPAALAQEAARAGASLPARRARAALERWMPRLDRAETIGDLDRAAAAGLQLLTPDCDRWPTQLADLGHHAPILLWVRGAPELLGTPALSVVGARAATAYGTQVTAELVDHLSAHALTIVSGAAYGVDAVAHRTALAAARPTVAVLAGGADRSYPEGHRDLIDRIARDGAVCGEMAPGSAPTRWRFLMRNRLIAALSLGTLVTEAGVRSGSLNTAGHAVELGRELGAVPGPITSAASAGCHTLIRDYQARLITSAADALELAGVADASLGAAEAAGAAGERLPSMQARVLDALPLRGGRDLTEIARRAGLSVDDARRTLAELELLRQTTRRDSGAGSPIWALVRRQ